MNRQMRFAPLIALLLACASPRGDASAPREAAVDAATTRDATAARPDARASTPDAAKPECLPGAMSIPLIGSDADPCQQDAPDCPSRCTPGAKLPLETRSMHTQCPLSGGFIAVSFCRDMRWDPSCQCLAKIGGLAVSQPMCGNGKREAGEACDGEVPPELSCGGQGTVT